MRTIAIDEIRIDEEGRPIVKPQVPPHEDYAYINRAARGVQWDPDSRTLRADSEHGGQAEALVRLVRAIESEYGDRLTITPGTRWSGVSEDLQRELQKIVKLQA